MTDVTKQIEKFTDSDMVKRYNDYSDYLIYLYGLPYLLVLSAVFFFGFWWKGGQCYCCFCCNKGSAMGCVYIFPHILFWFLFFLFNTIIFVIGAAFTFAGDKVPVPVLKGEPTLKDFLAHVQTEYPEFWDKVFA